jgi:mRNA-degrading endonuclease toxin of MazEF toxin-antitoxin module
VKVDRGTVILVELDATVGHEQRGLRPCIAVTDPAVNVDQIRSVDKRRIRSVFGRVTREELASVDGGLELFLGLDGGR